MPHPNATAPRSTREVWIVLGIIILLNCLFVGGIATKVIPFAAYAYGRFVIAAGSLVALVGFFRGRTGLAELIGPMGRWRVHPGWYLLALCWPGLICTLILVGKGLLVKANMLHVDLGIYSQPRALLMIATSSFTAEIIWVSYAISRLSGRFTTLESSLIVGVFWTLWWMPMVFLGVGVIPGLTFSTLLLNMFGVASTCGFIYFHSRSGLIVMILQTMFNSMLLVFPVVPVTGGAKTYWLFSFVYLVAALSLHVTFGPRPLFSFSRRTPAALHPAES